MLKKLNLLLFIKQHKLFIVSTLLFCFWYIDIWENANSCSRVLPIVTFAEQGNFILDKYQDKTIDISFVNGHYYMDKAPLPSLLTLPFFSILKTTGIVKPVNNSYYGSAVYITGAIICGILPFLFILYSTIKPLVEKKREQLVLMALISYFSSFLFVFSGTFFAHILAAAFVLAAYLHYCKQGYLFSGLMLGLAFLTEVTSIWVLVSWIIIELFKNKSFRNVFKLCLGFFPGALFIMAYNYYFTGNAFSMLYLFVANNFDAATKSTYGMGVPKLSALYGLIFSENRGILFYAPILLYGFLLFIRQHTGTPILRTLKQALLNPLFLPFLLTTLFISCHVAWEGGWSYGPRHLSAVCLLLLYGVVTSSGFGQFKVYFWILSFYGLSCTFLAKLTVLYSVPELDENILSYLISKLHDPLNIGNLVTLTTKHSPLLGFVIFIALFVTMMMSSPKRSSELLRNSKS